MSMLSLISNAAKQGPAALCQLFTDKPGTFLEAIRWLAPIDSQRWCEPLTTVIVNAVSHHASSLDFATRRKACEIIVKSVTDHAGAESLTLLSSILLSMRPKDEDDPSSSQDHLDFEQEVFHELKRCRWIGNKLVKILYFLRDFHIDDKAVDDKLSDTVHAIVTNFSNGIVNCASTDIPSACYNFLYLSEKLPNHSLAIVKAFVSSCESIVIRSHKLPSEDKINVLHAISTAAQSFGFSAKQDHQLAEALVKLLRFRAIRFGPFAFSLLLTLMDSSRHQKTLSSFIVSYALDSYRSLLWKSSSKFFPYLHKKVLQTSNPIDENDFGLFEDFDEVLDLMSQYCESGWEFFVPNLVDICFQLFTQYDKSCKASHPSLVTLPIKCLNHSALTPKLLAVRSALQCLQSIFNSYPSSRTTIVERTFQCILSDEYDPDNDGTDLNDKGDFGPAIVLLGQLIARHQIVFFDMLPQIRNSFDNLLNMSSNQSCQLIRSLVPIIQKRKDLSDALTIMIRKGLFSRHAHHRIMAVDVMLTLIKCASGIQAPHVQFSQSSSSSSTQITSDAQLFVEFKGLLHRVLSHQPQVRAHLYGALQKCLQSGSPALQKSIFDFLCSQLENFTESNRNEKLPFWIDRCIQSGTVIEPLPSLFHHFCQCVLSLSSTSSALYEQGSKIVNPILEQLSQCNLEDFAFERVESSTQSQATVSAPDSIVRDSLRLSSLFWLEIHEIAINYLLMRSPVLDMETVSQLMKFYKTYEQLKPTAHSRATGKRKTPEKPQVQMPYFSLKACNLLLGNLFGNADRGNNRRDVIAALRDNPEFIQYCLSSAIVDVENAFASIRTSLQSETFLALCCEISPKLLRLCHENLSAVQDSITNGSFVRKPGKTCPDLELFSQLLHKAVFFGPEAFKDFYRCLSLNDLPIFEGRQPHNPHDPDLFFECLEILFFKACNDRDIVFTEAASIVLSMLDACVPTFCNDIDPRRECVLEIYRRNVSVPALSANLLSYGYSIYKDFEAATKLLIKTAQDCVTAMGDIQEEILPTATTEMGFNSESTVPAITVRILQFLDSEFALAEWLLGIVKQIDLRLKETLADHFTDCSSPFADIRTKTVLDSISTLLYKSFQIAHELLQIRSKDPNLFKNVLKTLIRAFRLAINIVAAMQSSKRHHMHPRFVKMVEFIGRRIKPAIESLIKFNQEADVGARPQSKSATKRRIEGEKKLLPELTSYMEKFEHSCIRYSKTSKGAQLETYFARSAAFDFRFSISKALGDGAGADKRKKKKGHGKDKGGSPEGNAIEIIGDDRENSPDNDRTVSDVEGETIEDNGSR